MIEENQDCEEQVLVINISLTQRRVVLLMIGMLVAAFIGYLVLDHGWVSASTRQTSVTSSSGMRRYYLTKSMYEGNQPTGTDGNGAGVCIAGYHFASMWELLDPSNLKYNTSVGYIRNDSGQGPPSNVMGWVRTGNASSSSDTVGTGNCDNWTSFNSVGSFGPQAKFDSNWDTPGTFPAWVVGHNLSGCGSPTRVWCVQD